MTTQSFSTIIKLSFITLLILLTVSGNMVSAQNVRILTLDETILIAQKQSPDALMAMHRFRSSYWEYRNYKALLLPSLSLETTLPRITKGLEYFDDKFVMRNSVFYSAGLSLAQNIGLTGGQIFLNTDLTRLDKSNVTTYSAAPLVNIGINQPLFGHNELRWRKKIEPLKYNEAERRYIEDVEQVNIAATDAFFRLLDAQIRLKIQETNLANNDTLYQIARGRYNIGTIAENELLQIELSLLNARLAVSEALLEVERRMFDLRSYLRIPEDVELQLISPTAPNDLRIDAQIAITEARNNRSDALAFERRIFEAQQSVSAARSENRFNANLYASYGLDNSANVFNNLYTNPQESQVLNVGISVPILDWGLGKGRLKLAESNMELARTAVQQETVDFDQEVFIKVMQYNNLPLQLAIASKSDTVALKRYEVTKQRYLIGKIGITDLNIAQTEKDNAQQGYISALYSSWRNYYELRKLTLYDFVSKRKITFNFDEIPDVE